MKPYDVPRGRHGKTKWILFQAEKNNPKSVEVEMDFSNRNIRMRNIIEIFKRYSGSEFSIPMLAKRYEISDRMLQFDLEKLENQRLIQREMRKSESGENLPSKIHYIGPEPVARPMTLFTQKNLNKKLLKGEEDKNMFQVTIGIKNEKIKETIKNILNDFTPEESNEILAWCLGEGIEIGYEHDIEEVLNRN